MYLRAPIGLTVQAKLLFAGLFAVFFFREKERFATFARENYQRRIQMSVSTRGKATFKGICSRIGSEL